MDIYSIFIGLIYLLNMILAIVVIFLERKDAASTWAWLLVLFFIPLLGFAIYLLFGQNFSKKKKMFQWEDRKKIGIDEMLKMQISALHNRSLPAENEQVQNHYDLIHMQLVNNDAVLTQDNAIQMYTDGKDKFDALFKDIEGATDHIHLQYYILRRDALSKRLITLLNKKAREGVKVRILYDDLGSRSLTKRFFKSLREAGGEVEAFFPSKFHFINLRLNYRNHRKLVIIDGKIGYVGGFNVGDEYLGLNKKFGYWRDTHLRIEGSAVYAIQTRFILDWNQASHRHDIHYLPEYYPPITTKGRIPMQIVASGPDNELEQIKLGYIKMIMSAKETILIQTPYFIPDASVVDALRIAVLSGVNVKIMIPNKPDHMFVYWATYSYIGELLKLGAKVLIYDNGFIHAKTIVIDDEIASVGTANIDVRSFRLNFEVNAFIYDRKIAEEVAASFYNDVRVSRNLTLDDYNNRSFYIKFKESISRLLSPIL
ncbi:cardiolipin synthase [Cytobacillus sp. FSL W7-1323]|uniref:Cardiolipin synthase n=1 Tax=Cytobacillus kochii TaxID=859143 RepID=A0A248TKB2_9BACI|nr:MULTISPECIES: cardiolipin synthase [Cytobacillus]ASV68585.1 cardiolipin synthase [Cytobacillus kochii]MDQ0186115.1 cardiolipin synthase [Cytobacillus kochii]MEA1855184.1 cardiolipin synthase [Cytobacillus sp. OWB-43]MED1605953.1 cardiolipin synthase [Cytobacillus kochii]